MTYNEILETGNNPIIEIPRSAEWSRARRLTRPIKIHEDDLQDANPVR